MARLRLPSLQRRSGRRGLRQLATIGTTLLSLALGCSANSGGTGDGDSAILVRVKNERPQSIKVAIGAADYGRIAPGATTGYQPVANCENPVVVDGHQLDTASFCCASRGFENVCQGHWTYTIGVAGGFFESDDPNSSASTNGPPPFDSSSSSGAAGSQPSIANAVPGPNTDATGWSALSVGFHHTCALSVDGGASCWGQNSDGQANAPAGGHFTQVTAGSDHSCAITTDGGVSCWGCGSLCSNSSGGDSMPSVGPLREVHAGNGMTCAVTAQDELRCWGANYGPGELQAPAGMFKTADVFSSAGCAVRADGSVVCWGSTTEGSCMNQVCATARAAPPTVDPQCDLAPENALVCNTAVPVGPAERFSSVSVGGEHACGLHEDGTMACWGLEYCGEATAQSGTFIAVDVSPMYSCAIRSDHTLLCWGCDAGATPILVPGLATPPGANYVAIGTGLSHACALSDDGAIRCWGNEGGYQ